MSEQKDQLNPTALVGSIFKFSVATWINAILYALTLLIVSLVFSAQDGVFGLFDTFYTASMTVMTLAALGLDHAYIRFYNEPPKGMRDAKQLAAACMLLSCVSLFGFTIIMSLVFPAQVSALFFEEDTAQTRIIILICINAFFLLVSRYFNITYRMQQNVKLFNIQSILLQFFSRMFYIAGALFSPNLDSLIYVNLCGLGVFALVFFLMQRKTMLPKKMHFEREAYKPLLQYGLALAPTAVIQWASNLFSRVFVNESLGKTQLDVFSFVSMVSLALGIVQSGFATFWSAFMFASYKSEQRKIRRVHDYLTFIILSLMALLILLQPVIFAVFGLLSDKFSGGQSIFGLMLFAPMLLIISETTVYGIGISKKTIYDTIGMSISVGGNVLLSLWLIPKFGIVGAAVSLAVSGLAMFVFRTAVAQRFYKSMDNPFKTAISVALMAGLCVVSYLFAAQALVVALCAVGLLIYYVIAYRAECRRCFSIVKGLLQSRAKTV